VFLQWGYVIYGSRKTQKHNDDDGGDDDDDDEARACVMLYIS